MLRKAGMPKCQLPMSLPNNNHRQHTFIALVLQMTCTATSSCDSIWFCVFLRLHFFSVTLHFSNIQTRNSQQCDKDTQACTQELNIWFHYKIQTLILPHSHTDTHTHRMMACNNLIIMMRINHNATPPLHYTAEHNGNLNICLTCIRSSEHHSIDIIAIEKK